jgi:hypothetical protein
MPPGQALAREGLPLDADDEDMFYLRRLEGGLFTLQNIDFILAWLIMEDDGVRSTPGDGPRRANLLLTGDYLGVGLALGSGSSQAAPNAQGPDVPGDH